MMLAPSLQYQHKGRHLTYTRRATAAVEVCEATSGVAVTRRMLHKHHSEEVEEHGLLVRQGRVSAIIHVLSTAKSSVYRYQLSFDRS